MKAYLLFLIFLSIFCKKEKCAIEFQDFEEIFKDEIIVLDEWVKKEFMEIEDIIEEDIKVKEKIPHLKLDKYGGFLEIEGKNKDGFFRVELINGMYFFITPENHPMLSLAITTIEPIGDHCPKLGYAQYSHNLTSLYGKKEYIDTWAKGTELLLKETGINTIGGWSAGGIPYFSKSFPYTVSLGFRGGCANGTGGSVKVINEGGFIDVFDEKFEKNCFEYAEKSINEDMKNDPYLIGYFVDNEIHWWGDKLWWESPYDSLADDFITLSPDDAGKKYWVYDFISKKKGYSLDDLEKYYGLKIESIDELLEITKIANNPSYPKIAEDKAEFVGIVAERFLSVSNNALKSRDKNHLNLCVRFASYAPIEVVKASSKYCDVISVNDYYTNLEMPEPLGNPEERWKKMFIAGIQKPFILTEFGTRGEDSGLLNSWGAGMVVETQIERGKYYRETIEKLLSWEVNGIKFVAGFHWYMFRDQPKLGRFDGENSNYGIVTINNEKYITLVDALKEVNYEYQVKLLKKNFEKLKEIKIISHENGEKIKFKWEKNPDAKDYTLLISPLKSFPENLSFLFEGVKENEFEFPFPLSNGRYYYSIKAYGDSYFNSDYSKPLSFLVERMGEDNDCLLFEDLSCLKNKGIEEFPFYEGGEVYIFPEGKIKTQGEVSGKFVWTINSLSPKNPINGGKGEEIGVIMNLNNYYLIKNGKLYMDIYPLLSFTPQQNLLPSSKFIKIKIKNEKIIYDDFIDKEGEMKPFFWNKLEIKLPKENKIKFLEFYIDTSSPENPLDQRIIFYVDNIY